MGLFTPDAAALQPAKLARGLAHRVVAMGARLYEQTAVTDETFTFDNANPVVGGEYEDLPFPELRERAFKLAEKRHDLGFFVEPILGFVRVRRQVVERDRTLR